MMWLSVAFAAPPADDDAPTGRYLSPVEIHGLVIEQLEVLGSCYEHSAEARARTELGDVYLTWVIRPDGSVTDARIHESSSGLPELDACLLEAAGRLHFRAHDEPGIDVGYPMVWLDATLQPFPMVYVKERPLDLLFFYLPEEPVYVDILKPRPDPER
ncbi:MAG TPA: TonB family protein [Myxococcota bacterium]|nr:TonB family protein [Myxococcota bacterium]